MLEGKRLQFKRNRTAKETSISAFGMNILIETKNLARRVVELTSRAQGLLQPFVVKNVFRREETNLQRRALLHYLLFPFRMKDDRRFWWNQNLTVSKLLGEVIDEMGYVVDVAEYNDNRFSPDTEYDLIITHNLSCAPDLKQHLKAGGILIYLSSGQHHSISNAKIKARYEQLRQRTGFDLSPVLKAPENCENLEFVDAVIGFGNDVTASTWRQSFDGPILMFSNFAYDELLDLALTRDHFLTRKNFLYLGSADQVGRGLDLLLEVFARQNSLHLFVAGPYENEIEFVRAYAKLLFSTSNIHPLGRVDVRGKNFVRILQKCSFVVYPTCTEGSSGSLLVAMAGGLIPITTNDAGVDLKGCGILLDRISVPRLEEVVSDAAGRDPSWHQRQSEEVRSLVKNNHSLNGLRARLRTIVEQLSQVSLRETSVS